MTDHFYLDENEECLAPLDTPEWDEHFGQWYAWSATEEDICPIPRNWRFRVRYRNGEQYQCAAYSSERDDPFCWSDACGSTIAAFWLPDGASPTWPAKRMGLIHLSVVDALLERDRVQ